MRVKKETAPPNRSEAVNRTEQTKRERRRLSITSITSDKHKVNHFANLDKMVREREERGCTKIKRYTGRKTQRVISGIGAAVSILLVLGIFYGMEQGMMPLKLGGALVICGVICFAILLWGSGALE